MPERLYRDADGDGYGDPAASEERCPSEGWVADAGDCDDGSSSSHPGAPEVWYDGADEDCSGGSDFDQDGDGHDRGEDCDDLDATRYPDPSIPERWYDGVDDNCDGNDGDQDGDGWYVAGYPYEVPAAYAARQGDCADDPATSAAALNGLPDVTAEDVHPGADDAPYDGVDADCAAGDDFDHDGDGVRSDAWPDAAGATGADCDDDNPAVPAPTEDCGTAFDDTCDGATNELDALGCATWYEDLDGDGFGGDRSVCACEPVAPYDLGVGGDCDDADEARYPGAVELCDGVDNGCVSGWTTADEAGTVTQYDGGVATDVTGAWTGSSASPASPVLVEGSEVAICAGTWFVNLDAGARDVALRGSGEAVLDGAGGRIFDSYTASPTTVTLSGLTLQGGAAEDGAALRLAYVDLTLTDVVFSGNQATESGGAVYAYFGSLAWDGVTFEGNEAAAGGAAWVYGSSLEMGGGAFEDNHADEATGAYGGALAWLGLGLGGLGMDGVTFTGNRATSSAGEAWAGGVYAQTGHGDAVTVRACTFDGNEAVSDTVAALGGAFYLYATGGGDVLVDGSSFTGNLVDAPGDSFGGGLDLYLEAPDVVELSGNVIEDNVLRSDNTASGAGGAIGVSDASVTFTANTWRGNRLEDATGGGVGVGGGLTLSVSNVRLSLADEAVVDNLAGAAAGLYLLPADRSDVLLTDLVVQDNQGDGLVLLPLSDGLSLLVEGGDFLTNDGAGLALHAAYGDATLLLTASAVDDPDLAANHYGLELACAVEGGACEVSADAVDFEAGVGPNSACDLVEDGKCFTSLGDDVAFDCFELLGEIYCT